MKSAEWYFDEDVVGVAKILAATKLPVTWPGDDGKRRSERLHQTPSPIERMGLPDEQWIPRIARAGLPIVTRDSKILTRTNEINAVVSSNAQMFVITTRGSVSLWDQVRIVAAQWTRMSELRSVAGPFIVGLTLTSVRQLYTAPTDSDAGQS